MADTKKTKRAERAVTVSSGVIGLLQQGLSMRKSLREKLPRVTAARMREIGRVMAMPDSQVPVKLVTKQEFDRIAKEAIEGKKPKGAPVRVAYRIIA